MLKMTRTVAERIRRGETLPLPLALALEAASLAQRAGMTLRLRRKSTRAPVHVVSYGNLTAGGAGKTPAVIARASTECSAGRRVAILTRGYGAARSRKPLVRLPGEAAPPERFGDEAALIARHVPEACIVRSADRVAGARVAAELGCDLLILDDGFQAVALARDENILLIDAVNPFGNGRLLPRGILREPLSAMARATAVYITRCDQAPERLADIEFAAARYAPTAPILKFVHQPTHLWQVRDGRKHSLDLLTGAAVRAVCGIGNPEAFLTTLRSLGAETRETRILSDHERLSLSLLDSSLLVVITEKDAVRLTVEPPDNVYALVVTMAPYHAQA